jgi:hypothetical protein
VLLPDLERYDAYIAAREIKVVAEPSAMKVAVTMKVAVNNRQGDDRAIKGRSCHDKKDVNL